MASEITEEEDVEEALFAINTEAQKDKIRRIIEYQKSLYFSPPSSSSAAPSCSSFSSPRRSSSVLDSAKEGSTSLRWLFVVEQTSVKTHMNDYCGSPIIKSMKWIGSAIDSGNHGQSVLAAESSFMGEESVYQNGNSRISHRKLTTKKLFWRFPRVSLWRYRGFGFRLRLRRLRIMVCGRKF